VEFSFFEAALDVDTARLASGHDAVCVFVNDDVSGDVLKWLKRHSGVHLVLLRCAGFNNVDLGAAAVSGVRVARVPAYSPHSVAEHAVTLCMTVNRKVHKAYARNRDGNFSLAGLAGFDMHGGAVQVECS
jgi:D-lactate dehydrogenase